MNINPETQKRIDLLPIEVAHATMVITVDCHRRIVTVIKSRSSMKDTLDYLWCSFPNHVIKYFDVLAFPDKEL